MVLFVLHKLMHSHTLGLDAWFLVRPFVYFHTSCGRTAKALARLHKCAGSSEPSLVAYVTSTIISWAGSILSYLTEAESKLPLHLMLTHEFTLVSLICNPLKKSFLYFKLHVCELHSLIKYNQFLSILNQTFLNVCTNFLVFINFVLLVNPAKDCSSFPNYFFLISE